MGNSLVKKSSVGAASTVTALPSLPGSRQARPPTRAGRKGGKRPQPPARRTRVNAKEPQPPRACETTGTRRWFRDRTSSFLNHRDSRRRVDRLQLGVVRQSLGAELAADTGVLVAAEGGGEV